MKLPGGIRDDGYGVHPWDIGREKVIIPVCGNRVPYGEVLLSCLLYTSDAADE